MFTGAKRSGELLTRNQEIAERIQQRRLFLERRHRGEFTQERVAEKLGEAGYPISGMNYSHYERGRSSIPVDMLEKLASILGMPVGWFFNDDVPVDDFREEFMAALDDAIPYLSQEARDHLRRTVEILKANS